LHWRFEYRDGRSSQSVQIVLAQHRKNYKISIKPKALRADKAAGAGLLENEVNF